MKVKCFIKMTYQTRSKQENKQMICCSFSLYFYKMKENLNTEKENCERKTEIITSVLQMQIVASSVN